MLHTHLRAIQFAPLFKKLGVPPGPSHPHPAPTPTRAHTWHDTHLAEQPLQADAKARPEAGLGGRARQQRGGGDWLPVVVVQVHQGRPGAQLEHLSGPPGWGGGQGRVGGKEGWGLLCMHARGCQVV